jgi:flagellar FliJ protein
VSAGRNDRSHDRTHDRGLHAVRRVREARERDSRIGLQQALAGTRQRQAEAERAREQLENAPRFGSGSADDFRGHTRLLQALADTVTEKTEQLRTSRTVDAEANRRWGLDRQAVRTVELLLERRAEERREVRARHEAADLDELAAQAWLRNQTALSPVSEETPA